MIRNTLKLFIPPIFIWVYRKLRGTNRNKSTSNYFWEGVYNDFNEIKIDSSFEDQGGRIWTDFISASTQNTMNASNSKTTIFGNVIDDKMLMPLLVANVSSKEKKIKIVDIGGGTGSDYLHLKYSIANIDKVSYSVVELANVCDAGNKIFKDDEHIDFITDINRVKEDVDIIYFNSMLQYINDYPEFLGKICTLKPTYIFMVRSSVGDFPTFVTLQKNMPGMNMPYRFINIQELLKHMSKLNYELIYKSALGITPSMENFPKVYRMKNACNLLFLKKDVFDDRK